MNPIQSWLGQRIADYLMRRLPGYRPSAPPDPAALARILQPGDVVLVEGDTRIASVIKYLTQSTWSHAAIYVGPSPDGPADGGEPAVLVEADLRNGVALAPLSKYAAANVRVCRPVALTPVDRDALVAFLRGKVGEAYDLGNLIDLARYLLPLPAPSRFRRRMLAIGSGEPTRAICSTLIALAFETVRYPVLPRIEVAKRAGMTRYARAEILHIRNYKLYTPRDFDISPYFAIIKPTLESGFDYKRLVWGHELPPGVASQHADDHQAQLEP